MKRRYLHRRHAGELLHTDEVHANTVSSAATVKNNKGLNIDLFSSADELKLSLYIIGELLL